jgi:voltage-gated sodium channel type II alpha
LQVLNLFLALLLSNFGSSSLSAPTADNETNKIAEAFDRFSRFFNWIKRSALNVAKMLRAKLTNQISDQTPGEGPSSSWKEGLYPIRSLVLVRACVNVLLSVGSHLS